MSARQQYAVFPLNTKGTTKLHFTAVSGDTVFELANQVEKVSAKRDFFLVWGSDVREVVAKADMRKKEFDEWAALEVAA